MKTVFGHSGLGDLFILYAKLVTLAGSDGFGALAYDHYEDRPESLLELMREFLRWKGVPHKIFRQDKKEAYRRLRPQYDHFLNLSADGEMPLVARPWHWVPEADHVSLTPYTEWQPHKEDYIVIQVNGGSGQWREPRRWQKHDLCSIIKGFPKEKFITLGNDPTWTFQAPNLINQNRKLSLVESCAVMRRAKMAITFPSFWHYYALSCKIPVIVSEFPGKPQAECIRIHAAWRRHRHIVERLDFKNVEWLMAWQRARNFRVDLVRGDVSKNYKKDHTPA